MLNLTFCRNKSIKKVFEPFTIFFIFLLLLGCSPANNPGDLSVAASGQGVVLSGKNNVSISYNAIYGSEFGHSDPRKSDLRYGHLNLLVSLFVLMPQDGGWHYVGGGTGDIPWYYGLIYNNTSWLLYPYLDFAKNKANSTFDSASKKAFSWGFNGKKRSITIGENTYSISAGDYVVVKLDEHWKFEVGIGEKSLDKLQIPPETRKEILKCYMTITKGIGALGKCK